MVPYDRKVLNKLLDTYENSLLSTGENKRNIHIEMPFTRQNMPQYFDESSAEYETIHTVMKGLEEKGFLQIFWKNGKQDHVIQKVRLNPDQTDMAYRYLGREPRDTQEKQTLEVLEEYIRNEITPSPICKRKNRSFQNEILPSSMYEEKIRSYHEESDLLVSKSHPVTEMFAQYLADRINRHQSVKKYIDLADREKTKNLLYTLQCIEQNEQPCYIREFSMLHFHNSKYFERIEQHVVSIFRDFSDVYQDMEATEILSEYNIYRTPNYVYFKGDVTLSIQEKPLYLQPFHQGIGISGEDLYSIQFTDLTQIDQVITIENLTTFFRWREDRSLIIYLGGYHNRVRRELLKKIFQKKNDITYYHFGDLDAGGFSILKDLRAKTGIPFRAYHMDLATLIQYQQFGQCLTERDRVRLKELAAEPEWEDIIRYMLEHNVKLEQEVIGFDRQE